MFSATLLDMYFVHNSFNQLPILTCVCIVFNYNAKVLFVSVVR